jgi:hypothetical protein
LASTLGLLDNAGHNLDHRMWPLRHAWLSVAYQSVRVLPVSLLAPIAQPDKLLLKIPRTLGLPFGLARDAAIRGAEGAVLFIVLTQH